MLDYCEVKRKKRELMLNDGFVDGRGRIESVEYHTHEFVYLAGVADGLKAAGLSDEEVKRVIGLVG